MDILTPEQRAQAEELIKSRDASKGIDYSDCLTGEAAVAKFVSTMGLNSQQVNDATGPIGFIKDVDPAMFQRPENRGFWDGIRKPTFGSMNTMEISMDRNGPVLRMGSQGKHRGVCAHSAEQAKILLLGMTDDILQKYVEKADLTMKEMQWSN